MRQMIIAAVFVNNLGAIRLALEGKTNNLSYHSYSLASIVFGLWWIGLEYFSCKDK